MEFHFPQKENKSIDIICGFETFISCSQLQEQQQQKYIPFYLSPSFKNCELHFIYLLWGNSAVLRENGATPTIFHAEV